MEFSLSLWRRRVTNRKQLSLWFGPGWEEDVWCTGKCSILSGSLRAENYLIQLEHSGWELYYLDHRLSGPFESSSVARREAEIHFKKGNVTWQSKAS
jgi:hypothetical protein